MRIPYLKGAAKHAFIFSTKAQHMKLEMVKVASQTSYLLCPPLLRVLPTSFWHPFSDILCELLFLTSDLSCDMLCDRGWGPARHTELTGSRLRSGTPNWTHTIVVEVRHATLNWRDRGWGPARHTELTGSRLRSGTPHWTHRIVVEVRHATLNSQDRGWGPARHTELTGSRLRSGTPHSELTESRLRSGTSHWIHKKRMTEGQWGGGWRRGGGEGGEGRGGGGGPVLT